MTHHGGREFQAKTVEKKIIYILPGTAPVTTSRSLVDDVTGGSNPPEEDG